MTELSSHINQAAREEGLAEVFMPAVKFLEVDRTETAARIERLSGEMRELEPGIREAAKKLERESRTIEDYIKVLKAELEDAIGIEKPELTSRIGEASAKLKTLAEKAKANVKPLTEREEAIQATSTAQAKKAEVFQKILKAFPDASVLDLQCLVLLRNNVGLPALGLFNINSPVVWVAASSDETGVSIRTQGAEIKIPDPASRALRRVIETATGVSVKTLEYRTGGYYDDGEWITARTCPGWIQIEAKFPLNSRTIPHQAREIIRSAVKSTLFNQVLLLAEVEEWKVTYGNAPSSNPKIKGAVAAQPVTKDDPLILGTKLINGQITAFILGEFNTSKLEHYAGSEFSEKP